MATRKEPVVVVFEEPTYSRKSGREARKERDMFLVSLSVWYQKVGGHVGRGLYVDELGLCL